MATCYRHPGRETGVSCSNCERAICPDCMTPTSVGMRCPECSREKTQVRTIGSVASEPRVTYVVMALCAIVFLGGGDFSGAGGELFQRGALYGPSIATENEYWRLVTSGFLHAGIIHILFLLYLLGTMLEPQLGSLRFGTLYLTALLCGSFGALAQTTLTGTVGASGAVFGLMGAAAMEMRARGIDWMRSDIGMLIAFNLVFSFVLANISVGGHLGGLAGGVLAALALQQADRRRSRWLGIGLCLALCAVAVAGALTIAGSPGLTD